MYAQLWLHALYHCIQKEEELLQILTDHCICRLETWDDTAVSDCGHCHAVLVTIMAVTCFLKGTEVGVVAERCIQENICHRSTASSNSVDISLATWLKHSSRRNSNTKLFQPQFHLSQLQQQL